MFVDSHIKSILNLPTLKHESAKDMHYFLQRYYVNKNLRSLKVLDFERHKLRNVLFLNIILEELDRESRKQYELTLKDNEVPDFDEFLNWLERRNQILNSINSNAVVKFNQEKPKSLFVKNNKPTKNCRVCNLIHPIYHCQKFKETKLADRLEIVKRFKLCYYCLNSHLNFNCASNGVCRVCKKKSHHTLLHKCSTAVIDQTPLVESPIPIQSCSPTQTISPNHLDPQVSLFANGNKRSLLINTVIIYVKNSFGKKELRRILDSGSESNIITTKAVDLLGSPKQKTHILISGLNDCSLFVKNKVTTEISNQEGDEKWLIDLLVLPKITDYLPSRKINLSNLNIPDNLKLADSTFH
ncbi:DUF1758 domain-containing protein [Nephila pilipes]|uniref:DUF1758 domain-containing protein n=1 Tax=Nephila pilipes TaxID=299642 RepID=A0A8X6MYD6_NEPPI|nr:DUF1758 domain-containing protein [Nephila pilipes]